MRRMLFGLFSVGLLAGLLVLAMDLARREPPPLPEPLVLAVAKTVVGSPLWLAERQGFLAAEGLAVSLKPYASGIKAMEAMLRGEAEVATTAETPLVFAGLEGKPLRILANYASSGEHSLVARADRGIHQVKDLRGRRVGVAPGTASHYFLHVLLSDQGLAETDLEIVPLPVQEQAAALAAGRVDAVSAFAPYSRECRRLLGDNARVFQEEVRYMGYSSLVAAPDFAQRRPEAALRLLRATDRAILWMREHPQEALALAADILGMEAALLEEPWGRLRANLSLDQGFLVLLHTEALWAIRAGFAKGPVPNYRALIDPSTLRRLRPEAVTLVGVP